MAAIDLVLNLLPNGARIVCAHDCYGGTRRLMDARSQQRGFVLSYADCTDPAALDEALWNGADLVFFETPSNPRLRLTDLKSPAPRRKRRARLRLSTAQFCRPRFSARSRWARISLSAR